MGRAGYVCEPGARAASSFHPASDTLIVCLGFSFRFGGARIAQSFLLQCPTMTGSSNNGFIFAVVAAAIILLIYAIGILREKKRSAALQAVAPQMGFTYRNQGQPFDPAPLPEVALFNQGRSRRFRNLLNGWVAGMQAAAFDYQFTVGSGRNSRTVRQSVAAFKLPHPLANFQISPKTLGARVSALFGGQDIPFADHPEFSKRYRLRGRDEPSLRQFFTPPVLLYFEQLPANHWSIETSEGWLIVFHDGHRVPPAGISDFVQSTSNLAAGLTQV